MISSFHGTFWLKIISDLLYSLLKVFFSAIMFHIGRYFANKREGDSAIDMADEETLLDDSQRYQYVMAHNGWVMGDDPMRDFAKPGNNTYILYHLWSHIHFKFLPAIYKNLSR